MVIEEKIKAIGNILSSNIDGQPKITFKEESNLLIFDVKFGDKSTSIELNKENVIKTELSNIEDTFKKISLYNLVSDINNPHITVPDNNIVLVIGHSGQGI